MNVQRRYIREGRFPIYTLVVNGIELGVVRRKIAKGKDGLAGRGQPSYDVWEIHGTQLGTQSEAEERLIQRSVKFGTIS